VGVVGSEGLSGVSEVDVFEFNGGQVHELVFSQGVFFRGVFANFVEVGGEDGQSVVFVFWGGEGFVVFNSPSVEFVDDGDVNVGSEHWGGFFVEDNQ